MGSLTGTILRHTIGGGIGVGLAGVGRRSHDSINSRMVEPMVALMRVVEDVKIARLVIVKPRKEIETASGKHGWIIGKEE